MDPKNKNLPRRSFLKGLGSTALLTSSASSAQLLNNNFPSLQRSDCEFDAISNRVYLNSGTEGSMPTCVRSELTRLQHIWATNPTDSYEADLLLGKQQHQSRQTVATFLGVSKNNICITDNTTMGCAMVLTGLNLKENDRVIVTNHEHNAILSPLEVQKQRVGIKIVQRVFPESDVLTSISAQELLDYLFPDIGALRGAKALCVSHVYPATGTHIPLELLRDKADQLGIRYLIVDGAQAFGMFDVREGPNALTYSDFYACPGHKWLNGPPGSGFLYVSNAQIKPPEFFPTQGQRMLKFKDLNTDFPMVEALQVRGCSNAPGYGAMLTALDLYHRLEPAAVQNHILTLSNRVKNLILAQNPGALVSPVSDSTLGSGLTVFYPFRWTSPDQIFTDQKTVASVVERLREVGIKIRYVALEDGSKGKKFALRVSTAVFNTEDHVNQFGSALEEVLRDRLINPEGV